MKSLSTPGFQELEPSESRRIIGGVAWYVPVLIGSALYQVLTHWDHFKEGLSGSPEEPEK